MDPCASDSHDFVSSWKRDPTARDDELVIASAQLRSVARVARRHGARATRRRDLRADAIEDLGREMFASVAVVEDNDDRVDGGSGFSEEEARALKSRRHQVEVLMHCVRPRSASRLRPQSAHAHQRMDLTLRSVPRPQSATASRRVPVHSQQPHDFEWMPQAMKESKWTEMLQTGPRFQERSLQRLETETYALLQQVLRGPSPRRRQWDLHSRAKSGSETAAEKKAKLKKSQLADTAALRSGAVPVGSGLQVARKISKAAKTRSQERDRPLVEGTHTGSVRNGRRSSLPSQSGNQAAAIDRRAVIEKTKARFSATARDPRTSEASIHVSEKQVKKHVVSAEARANVMREMGWLDDLELQKAPVKNTNSKTRTPRNGDDVSRLLDDVEESLPSKAVGSPGFTWEDCDRSTINWTTIPRETRDTSASNAATSQVAKRHAPQSSPQYGTRPDVKIGGIGCGSLFPVSNPLALQCEGTLSGSAPPPHEDEEEPSVTADNWTYRREDPSQNRERERASTRSQQTPILKDVATANEAPRSGHVCASFSQQDAIDRESHLHGIDESMHVVPPDLCMNDVAVVDLVLLGTKGGNKSPPTTDETVQDTTIDSAFSAHEKKDRDKTGCGDSIEHFQEILAKSDDDDPFGLGDTEVGDAAVYISPRTETDGNEEIARKLQEQVAAQDEASDDGPPANCTACFQVAEGGVSGDNVTAQSAVEASPSSTCAPQDSSNSTASDSYLLLATTQHGDAGDTCSKEWRSADATMRRHAVDMDANAKHAEKICDEHFGNVAAVEKDRWDHEDAAPPRTQLVVVYVTTHHVSVHDSPHHGGDPAEACQREVQEQSRAQAATRIQMKWQRHGAARARQPRPQHYCGREQHASRLLRHHDGVVLAVVERHHLVQRGRAAHVHLRMGECKIAVAAVEEVEGVHLAPEVEKEDALHRCRIAAAHRIHQQYRRHVDRRTLLDQLAFVVRQHRRESRKKSRWLSSGQGTDGTAAVVLTDLANLRPHVVPEDTVAGLSNDSHLQGDYAMGKLLASPLPPDDLANRPVQEEDALQLCVQSPHVHETDVAEMRSTSFHGLSLSKQCMDEMSRETGIVQRDVVVVDDGQSLVEPKHGEQSAGVDHAAASTTRDLATSELVGTTWERYMDSGTNKSFYYSAQHELSQWTRPTDTNTTVVDRTVDPHVATAEAEDDDDVVEVASNMSTATVLGLRDRWERYMDTETNKAFYFNRTCQRSQWERPQDVPVTDVAAMVATNSSSVMLNTVAAQHDAREDGGAHRDRTSHDAAVLAGSEQGLGKDSVENCDPRHVDQREFVDGEPTESTDAKAEESVLATSTSERWTLRRNSSQRGDRRGEWQAFVDPDSLQPFYYNTRSGESTWDKPLVFGGASLLLLATSAPHWVLYQDAETGQPYYVNLHTNETSWERPLGFDAVVREPHEDLSRLRGIGEHHSEPPVATAGEDQDDRDDASSPVDDYVISIHDEDDAAAWLAAA